MLRKIINRKPKPVFIQLNDWITARIDQDEGISLIVTTKHRSDHPNIKKVRDKIHAALNNKGVEFELWHEWSDKVSDIDEFAGLNDDGIIYFDHCFKVTIVNKVKE